MSDDPETTRQIRELAHDARPLLVLDVDEVVLEFMTPFIAYLGHRGYAFKTQSFRLTGNVTHAASGEEAGGDTVAGLLDDFFGAQDDWQTAADGAWAAIERLGEKAQIVMLTAMAHHHHQRRRQLLDRLGFSAPLVTTETAKGPAVAMLAGERSAPVAFVDDIPHNLVSVGKSYPRASLFHLMAHGEMRALLPSLPAGVTGVETWESAAVAIASALEI